MPSPARTRQRFVMVALISGAVMINYLDRAIIGVATPPGIWAAK